MAHLRRSWFFSLAVVVCLSMAYALLFGPLFAWSPVKPGYEALHLSRADVFFGAGKRLDPALRHVDEAIDATERFHQLTLSHRMTIVVCRNWSDFHRFMPTVRGEGMGAATPEYGTVIYLTPKIEQMAFDTGEFLRHELSHAALEQNSTLWNSLQFKKAPWLLEGLAVLAAQQKAYGTWEDFLRWNQQTSVVPLFASDPAKADGFTIRSAYLAWRYFLAWRIETGGRGVFQEFLTTFMRRPTEAARVFREVYGEDLPTAAGRFETAVRSGQWNAQ